MPGKAYREDGEMYRDSGSGGLRRRGRGLGFAGRTEDRMSGRLTGCGGSGEPDPAEKRSSSSSSKAAEADWSPAAVGVRKEPRKRSALGELLTRARSMVEALFGLHVVLVAHISREKNLQCMEY